MRSTKWICLVFAGMLMVAACGDDNGGDSSDDTTPSTDPSDSAATPPSGGGSGSVTVNGSTTTFDDVECLLEGSPDLGASLLGVDASGTNDDGDEVDLEFRRNPDDSVLLGGDQFVVEVGGVFYGGPLDDGIVVFENDSFNASDFSVPDDDGIDATVSFAIDC